MQRMVLWVMKLLVIVCHCGIGQSFTVPSTLLSSTSGRAAFHSNKSQRIIIIRRHHRRRQQWRQLLSSPEDQESTESTEEEWDTSTPSTTSITSVKMDSYKRQQQLELEALRSNVQQKSTSSNNLSNRQNGMGEETQSERDTFVPVLAVISLMGLFGSYGFEMLRLYSKGELYLPWNN